MALTHLLSKCNQKCVFCSYPADTAKASGTGLNDWLAEAGAMKDKLVQISGGEPLLADPASLLKLLDWCAKKGKRVELQTNGLVLAEMAEAGLKELIKALKACGGYFNVNFSSDTAALDLKVTRTPGAFAKRVKAVKRLLALGAEVRLTHILFSLNYKRPEEFVKFVLKNFKGLAVLQFSFIKGLGRGAAGSRIIPKYSEAGPYLRKALTICTNGGLKCQVDHIPLCFLGPHFKMSVDVAKMIGWASGPYLEEKRKIKACGGCKMARICPGPRIDYIKIYDGLK